MGSEKVGNGLHSQQAATFPATRVSEAVEQQWQLKAAFASVIVNTSEHNFSSPFHIVAPDLVVDEIFICVCINVNIDVSSTCHTK